ncbi:chromate transporter [Sphingomonas oryzagri]
MDASNFLAGYGAAQAVPRPLFTFATFLLTRTAGLPGAVISTVAIFLPAALLVAGVRPFEHAGSYHTVQKALAGINAAAVGIMITTLVTGSF